MPGTWDPEMPETQPLPFEAHNLVGEQRCGKSQLEVSTRCLEGDAK